MSKLAATLAFSLVLGCSSPILAVETFNTVTEFKESLTQKIQSHDALTQEQSNGIARFLNGSVLPLAKKTNEKDVKKDRNIIFEGLSLLRLAALNEDINHDDIITTLLGNPYEAKVTEGITKPYDVMIHCSVLAVLFNNNTEDQKFSETLTQYWLRHNQKMPENIQDLVIRNYGKDFQEKYKAITDDYVDNIVYQVEEFAKNNMLEDANKLLNKATEISIKNNDSGTIMILAMFYSGDEDIAKLEDLEKAKKLLDKAKEIAFKNNDFEHIITLATMIYASDDEDLAKLKDLEKAKEILQQAEETAFENKDINNLLLLVAIYACEQDDDELNKLRDLEKAKKVSGHVEKQAINVNNADILLKLATATYNLIDKQKGLQLFQKSEEIAINQSDVMTLTELAHNNVFSNLAKSHDNRFERAKDLLNLAESKSTTLKDPKILLQLAEKYTLLYQEQKYQNKKPDESLLNSVKSICERIQILPETKNNKKLSEKVKKLLQEIEKMIINN